MDETFKLSITHLLEGKYLFVAPEDSELEPDPITGIRPFMRGFLHLGELYAEITGRHLQFYPVTIHEAGLVIIDKPLAYNPNNEAHRERFRLINLLETTIKARYAEITEDYSLAPELTEKIIT